MSDISIRQALAPPAVILAAMVVSAFAVSRYTLVDGSRVFVPYFSGWGAATFLSVLLWLFIATTSLARARASEPIEKLFFDFREKAVLLLIPAFVFPLFLGSYTWAKASIPFAVGYPWESFWANLDRAILGTDAWRLAHLVSPPQLASFWATFYAIFWGLVLVFSGTLISLFACRRTISVFFTSMMLSWLLGGFVLAYAFSAAGPIFAHLVDSSFATRYLQLRTDLLAILGPDNIVMRTQRYLALGLDNKVALKGYGISAMPSMHIASATIYVLAARGTRWLPMAALFLIMTFFGSVYLGYHYAVDAPVAALVAAACWKMALWLYSWDRRYLERSSDAAASSPA